MSSQPIADVKPDYNVADISFAGWGRREIAVAEIARLHLEKLGAKLTVLTPEQADYIGVEVEGPYKPDYHRY